MSNTDKGSREYDDISTIAGNEAVGGRELPPVYLRRKWQIVSFACPIRCLRPVLLT